MIARNQPQHVTHLIGYQILILEANNEYQNNLWLAYYRQFRHQATSQPSCRWSVIKPTLWNLAFTGQARASHCRHCFSLFHQSKDCEFAPTVITSSSHDPPPPFHTPGRRRFICRQWNKQLAEKCSFPSC